MKTWKTAAVCCLATVFVMPVWAARDRADKKAIKIGEKAPDFDLRSADGKTVKLSDFAGKIVVLEWTNHQCPVVGRYVVKQKAMQKTAAQFKGKDVVWLAVDSSHFCADEVDNIKKFCGENKIGYPILLDADGKVGKMFGATSTPHMFVVAKDGTLAYRGSFDDDRYGDKESPRNYVSEAVESLLNGSTVPVSSTRPFGCSVKYKQ